MFTLKRFMAVWEVLRHFRSIFTTTFYMLIPLFNLPAALSYCYRHIGELPAIYSRKMTQNFYEGINAFTLTKQYWSMWLSESLLSLLYIGIAFFMNIFWVGKLLEYGTPYVDMLSSIKPEWVNWLGYAVAALIAIYVVRVLTGMLHAIWKTQTSFNPEYATGPLDPSFVRMRDEAIAKRAAPLIPPVDVVTAAKNNVSISYGA